MSSQTDLDQGGTDRQWVRAYMGPSVGYIWVPNQNKLLITATGTYLIDPSTSLVQVNVAAVVTLTLPSLAAPTGGAQAQPNLFAGNPIVIEDLGGNAAAFNITIQRNNANDSIMGLASITIGTNFGAYTLLPNLTTRRWTSISP